jgi:hypothetical protein
MQTNKFPDAVYSIVKTSTVNEYAFGGNGGVYFGTLFD